MALRCVLSLSGVWPCTLTPARTAVTFDALMIVLAMGTLNIFHPGRLLIPEQGDAGHALVSFTKVDGLSHALA
jgi:hypothetical protein